jgi:peptidoglycan-N-acetylglucosamine deacetylase
MNKKLLKSLFLLIASFLFYHSCQATSTEYKPMQACRSTGKIETTKKIVALTFDDGPHEKYTKEILDILEEQGIKATFFVVGENAVRHPYIIRMAYLNGNIIANHSFSHADLTKISEDELKSEILRTSKAIYRIIDEYPILIRPPYGACSPKSIRTTCKLGFRTIAWSDMTNDYDPKMTSEKIADDIITNAHPGAIIGMHDGGGNREKTVKALPIIIERLKKEGYSFLTVPELLNIEAYRTVNNTINK